MFRALTILVFASVVCPARAQTGLDGCLYWLDSVSVKWSARDWKQQAHYVRNAGLRHIIVVGPAGSILKDQPDAMLQAADHLMAACAGTDMRVYVSLWSHPQWYARWDLDEELNANRKVVQSLAERYGAHANFAGWYIPHEIYVMWDNQAEYMTGLYGGLSRLCKQAAPGKTVIVSPFFILDRAGHLGDFRFAEPDEYEEFWYELLRQTEIDVVALQDSGEHLSFYTLDDRRPFMSAMKQACIRAGKQLWINIETGELQADSYADYERKFGRKTHVNDPRTAKHWRVVPPDKLREKVRLAREFADTTITWGYREYWDPMRGPAARQAYDAYLNRSALGAQTKPEARTDARKRCQDDFPAMLASARKRCQDDFPAMLARMLAMSMLIHPDTFFAEPEGQAREDPSPDFKTETLPADSGTG